MNIILFFFFFKNNNKILKTEFVRKSEEKPAFLKCLYKVHPDHASVEAQGMTQVRAGLNQFYKFYNFCDKKNPQFSFIWQLALFPLLERQLPVGRVLSSSQQPTSVDVKPTQPPPFRKKIKIFENFFLTKSTFSFTFFISGFWSNCVLLSYFKTAVFLKLILLYSSFHCIYFEFGIIAKSNHVHFTDV